ncbi:hypothetical protein HOY80DRAFT_101412 [Tuber brumale]|nr:hypothetical protein HOY80DRAFT_101412 [Tuber brumale]
MRALSLSLGLCRMIYIAVGYRDCEVSYRIISYQYSFVLCEHISHSRLCGLLARVWWWWCSRQKSPTVLVLCASSFRVVRKSAPKPTHSHAPKHLTIPYHTSRTQQLLVLTCFATTALFLHIQETHFFAAPKTSVSIEPSPAPLFSAFLWSALAAVREREKRKKKKEKTVLTVPIPPCESGFNRLRLRPGKCSTLLRQRLDTAAPNIALVEVSFSAGNPPDGAGTDLSSISASCTLTPS